MYPKCPSQEIWMVHLNAKEAKAEEGLMLQPHRNIPTEKVETPTAAPPTTRE